MVIFGEYRYNGLRLNGRRVFCRWFNFELIKLAPVTYEWYFVSLSNTGLSYLTEKNPTVILFWHLVNSMIDLKTWWKLNYPPFEPRIRAIKTDEQKKNETKSTHKHIWTWKPQQLLWWSTNEWPDFSTKLIDSN